MKCLNCGIETTNPKFCSRSCSASYTNKGKRKSLETKEKIKQKILSLPKTKKPKSKRLYSCVICGKEHNKWGVKTCSKTCFSLLMKDVGSKTMSTRDRRNYGRHKQSYMEQSFETWLKENNYTNFKTEVRFYNPNLRKNYYVDFLFEDKKLIVELDGTQHTKTIEQDKQRDQFISDTYGYTIIRISHKEYRLNLKKDLLLKYLDPSGGIEPRAVHPALNGSV
jgi:very-short-patch-repair endonuclease